MSMTSELRKLLPQKPDTVRVSELKAKFTGAVARSIGRLDMNIYDLIVLLVVVLSFSVKHPWYAYLMGFLVCFRLLMASEKERSRRLREKLEANKAKAVK